MALIARRARIWRPSSPAPTPEYPPPKAPETAMRTDITDCGCDDLPDGTPVDRHVVIRIIAGHGHILRLDIDYPPHG